MKKRLMICALAIALVGLSSALIVYRTAGEDGDVDENVQIVVVDGKTYRVPLASTKSYRRELQRFGGGAALLFDDLDRWFEGLWRGRSLAITLAWITAFVSVGLFLFARQLPSDPVPIPRRNDPGGG